MTMRVRLLLLSLLLLGSPGCGWYYLEKDPGELDLKVEAPEFDLESQAGEQVSLSGLRAQGNVVLVFYRGHW